MKKYIKCALVIALCLSLLIPISACSRKQTVIKLNEVTHSVFYAPQYAAMYLGFFEDEGLSIELVNGGGADKTMTALVSGQADIGLMGPEASIYVYNEGKEDHAVIVGQLTRRDGAFLVARNAMLGFSWTQLAGKSVLGGRKGGVPEMTLEYVLKENGLIPGEDIDVMTNIQFNLMAGAFTSGTGDFVTLFEPTATELEIEGKGYVVASVGEAAGEVPYTAYTVRKGYLEENGDKVERFMRAIQKGLIWVRDNAPEEIAKVIAPAFPDTSLTVLANAAKRYKEINAWYDNAVLDKEAFEKLQDIMQLAGELDKRASYEDIVNNSFAQKVK